MKYAKRAQELAQTIVDAFEAGQIPQAMASVYLKLDYDYPARSWSLRNRLLAALRGHEDARGFRQWKSVGRSVRQGERAFQIFVPMFRKAPEDDEEKGIKKGDRVLVGYKTANVFGYRQTDGEPLPGRAEERRFLDSLPLVEVARHWGIALGTFTGTPGGAEGTYRSSETDPAISLGVRNISTWAHELIHAADHRLGRLTPGFGQKLDNEVVAELGAAVLLEMVGLTDESDRGGAYRYIAGYCARHDEPLIPTVLGLLDRVGASVSHILEAAEQLGCDLFSSDTPQAHAA